MMNSDSKRSPKRMSRVSGFTLLELVVALAVIMIVAGIAVPQFLTMLHGARLKGAVTDFASLVQVQRLRAVDDDRYYSIYILAGNVSLDAFLVIYPQQNNGTSESQGAAFKCVVNGCEPSVV